MSLPAAMSCPEKCRQKNTRSSVRRNVTITAYLTAALILAIRDSCMDFGYLSPRRPVTVSVPVNLRTLFPSRTMRNFFAVANVCVPLKEEMGFEEILEKVCTELSEKTSRSHLNGKSCRMSVWNEIWQLNLYRSS